MTWLQRYGVRHYVANSLWIPPVLSMAVAIAAALSLPFHREQA